MLSWYLFREFYESTDYILRNFILYEPFIFPKATNKTMAWNALYNEQNYINIIKNIIFDKIRFLVIGLLKAMIEAM